MNNVFEQKKFLVEKLFGTPGTPDQKNISGPAQPDPAGPPGVPKVVKIVPLGSLTLLKRSGTPMVHGKGGVDRSVTPPPAKVMTKTSFFGLFWGVWAVFGAGWARDYVVGVKTGKNGQKLKMS